MKRILLPTLGTLALVVLVVAALDLDPARLGEQVAARLAALSVPGVLLAFALYGGVYVCRAVRFAVLLQGPTHIPHLVSVAGRHNLLNLVLPFRTGEVSLPLMLKREAGRPLAEGAATLFVCRVLDLACVATFMTVGLLWQGERRGGDGGAESAAVTVQVALVLGGLVLGLVLLRPVAGWLGARLAPGDATGTGLVLRLRRFVAAGGAHLDALSTGRLLRAGFVSLLTWGLTYGSLYALIGAMAGDDAIGRALGAVDPATHLVGSTGLHLTAILPINTVAGVGAWEGGWSAGFVFAGLDAEAAGISAVVSHLVVFGFIALIGGLGFAFRPRPLAPTVPPTDPSPGSA